MPQPQEDRAPFPLHYAYRSHSSKMIRSHSTFDPATGLVFAETQASGKRQRYGADWIGEFKTPRLVDLTKKGKGWRREGEEEGPRGARRLFDVAKDAVARSMRSISPPHLDGMPWRIAREVWATLGEMYVPCPNPCQDLSLPQFQPLLLGRVSRSLCGLSRAALPKILQRLKRKCIYYGTHALTLLLTCCDKISGGPRVSTPGAPLQPLTRIPSATRGTGTCSTSGAPPCRWPSTLPASIPPR